MGAWDSRPLRRKSSVRMQHFVRLLYVPFRRFLGDVRQDFLQRLNVALHGTLDFALRDALHECNVDAMACLHIPRT
jgi:hypothetical protein